MSILTLTCNHCGASLDVPEQTRFLTCTACASELVVYDDGNKACTDILTVAKALEWALEKQTDRDAEGVKGATTSDSGPPKPKRRSHQFSLRSIFLLTAAVAGLLGLFQLSVELGIAWLFFSFFAVTQGIFVMKSAQLPHGRSPGRRATAVWVLVTWAILVPWVCCLPPSWRTMPGSPWLQIAYEWLAEINRSFAWTTPLVVAAIGGFSRGSLRFSLALIAMQVLLAVVVILIGILIMTWIGSMFAWPHV